MRVSLPVRCSLRDKESDGENPAAPRVRVELRFQRMKNIVTNPDKDRDIDEDTGLEVDYTSLRYIELAGDSSKNPAKEWGGYSQDFNDAKQVLDHENVEAHPSDSWGIVDIEDRDHMSLALLIFDIDLYKLPDNFDATRVEIPDGTLITESQHGGLHAYYAIRAWRGEYSESDFSVHEELPIDIRGSAVSAHVVAPSDIPGVSGDYEIVNNEPIKVVDGPEEAIEKIEIDGEPAIEFDPNRSAGDIDWDQPEDPPDELPTCYHAGLSLRRDAPDDSDLNSHKVNVLTGLCGLAAGYEPDEVSQHMCGEYAPRDGETNLSDKETTEYQVQHLYGKLDDGEYSPPAVSTLREYGILDVDEGCGADCPIDGHGPSRTDGERKALETICEQLERKREYDDRKEELKEEKKEEYKEENGIDEDDNLTQDDRSEIWDMVDEELDVSYSKSAVKNAIVDLCDADYAEYRSALTDAFYPGWSESKLDRQRDLKQQVQHDRIFTEANKVKQIDGGSFGDYGTTTLFDFALDVERFVNLEDGQEIADVTITPAQNPSKQYSTEVDPDIFNQVRDFKKELMSQTFDTTIRTDPTSSVRAVRKWIGRQDVPRLIGQESMGLSQSFDEFVLPSGTIGSDGWADEPDTVFYSNDWAIEDRVQLTPAEYPEYDEDTVAEMIELLTQTREPERGLPVFGWFYATPFKRQIMGAEGQHNALAVSADSGAGKTALLKLLGGLFGTDGSPSNLEDSPWSFKTKFLASRGVPIWFDEYKREDLSDYHVDRIHRYLRSTTSGEMVESGNQDRSTEGWTLLSPVVISGEDGINGSAEERRSIQVQLLRHATEDDEFVEPFKRLAGEDFIDDDEVTAADADYPLPEHALAYYSWIAGMSDDEFRAAWREAKRYAVERVSEWGSDDELSDMELQGLQTVVFGFQQMRDFAEHVGADVDALPGWDELDAALQHIAPVGSDAREPHTDRYARQIALAALDEYLDEGKHYKVVKAGKSGEQLRVNLNRAHDKVLRYIREHGADVDVLSAVDDYKTRFKEQYDRGDGYVVNWSQNTPPIGRCIGIDMRIADEEIAGFERSVFVDGADSEDGESASNDNDSDGDGSGPTPVNALDEKDGDYVDVTVEVVDWDVTPDEVVGAGGPMADGSVADSEGRVDVVSFEFESPPGVDFTEGECYRIAKCKAEEYNGSMQLRLDDGTEIEPIQPGVDLSPGEGVDDEQDQLDEDDDAVNDDADDAAESGPDASDTDEDGADAARADGGNTTGSDDSMPQADRVTAIRNIIEQEKMSDTSRGAAVEDVLDAAEDRGISRDAAEATIDNLRHKGELYNPEEGVLKTA